MSFAIGQQVQLRGARGTYEVIQLPNKKGEMVIATGTIKLTVQAELLQPAKAKKAARKIPRSRKSVAPSGGVLKVDLHRLRVAEALERVERLIDEGLLKNVEKLEIIHGIGTGALKTAVHKYLSACSHVSAFKIDERNPGTTWIYL